MLDELFKQFDGAFAESTIKAYRSDFTHFSDWSRQNNLSPMDISPQGLANYIDYQSQRLASATVRRHVGSIGTVLRMSGREDITKQAAVILAVKRMHRRKGRAQRQAIPLTEDVLDQLLAICGDDARGLRDRVLLRLGYETMRRRAELCRFKFSDIVTLPSGRAGIRLSFSKTDQFGKGKLIPITPLLCQAIDEWGEQAGRQGALLKRVNKIGAIGPCLHPGSVSRLLQELQLKAGLKLEGRLTGHSFRVGAALDLLERGETLEKIMLRGGWHSEATVVRYLREWQAL